MRNWILQEQNKVRDYILMGIFLLGAAALRLFYITRTTGPFIYADEFGYWSHAAHMAGQTWAGVMDGVSWYSFGYSFWLTPIFLFSHQMATMYHAAILLNAVLGVTNFVLAYRITTKLMNSRNTVACGLIALAATSFPTYIFYSHTTMAETLVALIVWLMLYELVSLEENPIWCKGAVLGLTSGYAYMVHNRMLTAILAGAVCLAVLWIMRKIDWRVTVSYVIAFLSMITAYVFLKDWLESMVVTNHALGETGTVVARGQYNTLSFMIGKFFRVFRPERMGKLFLSIWGELWQFLTSTYLLAGLGAVFCISGIKKNFGLKKRLCIYAYPIAAFIISAGMTAVATQGSLKPVDGKVRIDSWFYGRYNECYFPIFIMIALVGLCSGKLRDVLKIFLTVAVVYLGLSLGMFLRLRGIEGGYINIVSSVSIHIFHWLGEFSVWKCAGIALLGGGVIAGLCCFNRIGHLGRYAGMTVLVLLFSTTALYCMRTSIRGENDYTMQYAPLYDYLNENMEKGEIAYITTNGKPAFDLQSRLVDKPVVVMWTEELDTATEPAYAVIRAEELEEVPVDYEICLECEDFLVLGLN